MDLIDAIKTAEGMGCEISKPRLTGEVLFVYRPLNLRERGNGRRKDTPRKLTTFLRKVHHHTRTTRQGG